MAYTQQQRRVIFDYNITRKNLLDAGFSYGSSSGNEMVLLHFQKDLTKSEHIAPSDIRILHNPALSQYELYVRHSSKKSQFTPRSTRTRVLALA